jgi:hypothetical protein
VAIITTVSITAAGVGLRALLRLYLGYGLNSVEELRQYSYCVSATVAMLTISAAGFQFGDPLSRLLLGLFFAGL